MTDGWPASWPRAGAAHIFPCAPNEHFTHHSHNQSHAKDAALRERCAETRWTVRVADPPRGLSIRCEGSGGPVPRSACTRPRQALHVRPLLITPATCPSGGPPPAFCPRGPQCWLEVVSDSPGSSEAVNQHKPSHYF